MPSVACPSDRGARKYVCPLGWQHAWTRCGGELRAQIDDRCESSRQQRTSVRACTDQMGRERARSRESRSLAGRVPLGPSDTGVKAVPASRCPPSRWRIARVRDASARRPIRLRSSGVVPPHMPNSAPVFIAYSRHRVRTGQLRQITRASSNWLSPGPSCQWGRTDLGLRRRRRPRSTRHPCYGGRARRTESCREDHHHEVTALNLLGVR